MGPGWKSGFLLMGWNRMKQSVEAMMELPPGEKEEFLTDIYKALASISTLRDKVRDRHMGRSQVPAPAGEVALCRLRQYARLAIVAVR